MATGKGSMSVDEACSVQDKLEVSPSKNQASSRIYNGGGGGKKGKKSGSKMEDPAKDKMPGGKGGY